MSIVDYLQFTIDFKGQQRAEKLMYLLLVASGILCFIAGYTTQSLQVLLGVFTAGLVLTLLVVLPSWPLYNKHPEPFIEKKVE